MNKKKNEPMLLVIMAFAVVCMVFMVAYSLKEDTSAVMTGVYADESQSASTANNTSKTMSETTKTVSQTTIETTSETTTVPATKTPETTTATETGKPSQTSKLPEGKVAYLTFDDGPSENTEEILDILDRYGVKATFFVISKKNMDSKYRMIVERGHTIALHAYSHTYSKIYKSENAYFEDLRKIDDKVYNITGVRSKIIRFPGGSSNTVHRKYCKGLMKRLKVSVTEKGYIYHDWNVDSGDASGKNVPAEKLIDNIKKYSKDKNVIDILMHDTGASKQTTVEALPEIIEFLLSEGYIILPITESTPPIQHK